MTFPTQNYPLKNTSFRKPDVVTEKLGTSHSDVEGPLPGETGRLESKVLLIWLRTLRILNSHPREDLHPWYETTHVPNPKNHVV